MSWIAALTFVVSGLIAAGMIRRAPAGAVTQGPRAVSIGALIGVGLLIADHHSLPLGAGRALATALAFAALVLARPLPGVAAAILASAGVALLGALSGSSPTVVAWGGTPWTVVHVVFGVASVAATTVAAGHAALALRRRPIALIVFALLLTALPLVSRAGDIVLHQGGSPLVLDVPIIDPDGAQGLVRTVVATWRLPIEWLLRVAASMALVVLLFLAIRSRAAGNAPPRRATGAVFALLTVHALVYIVVLLPVPIDAKPEQLVERLLLGELQGTESLPLFALSDLTGGLRASGFPLFLALVSLGFVWLSTRAVHLDSGSPDAGDAAIGSDPAALPPGDLADSPDDRRTDAACVAAAALIGATALTGIGWSNYVWGGYLIPDPKLFASVVALGLHVLYLWTRATLPRWGSARAAFVLAAAFVTFWSLIGPSLGVVTPGLHDFGR